ncbi:MAG: aminoacyl-tRNA hydrolase [Elusimicrobiaceae bacterium]|nr:aminoacyl-tRNA hydrolase [Elusimicrobiaceae bacterium]
MQRFLIAGLGNPGTQYEKTRHNAGFMVADALAAAHGVSFQPWQKLGEYAKISVNDKEVFIVKPMTYMNLSGQMVSNLARFYKIPASNILVCFDDLSLKIGDIRLRPSGSAGGQKGMKNIIELLGTDKIARLRVGIGPKPERFDTANFVLSKFTKEETPLLARALERAEQALELYLKDGLERAMNQFN